jgi:hypothetical protein
MTATQGAAINRGRNVVKLASARAIAGSTPFEIQLANRRPLAYGLRDKDRVIQRTKPHANPQQYWQIKVYGERRTTPIILQRNAEAAHALDHQAVAVAACLTAKEPPDIDLLLGTGHRLHLRLLIT